MEMLEFPGIAHARHTNAADLAFGERRLVEIARALAANPAIMLLDEPAAGINPAETENLDEILTGCAMKRTARMSSLPISGRMKSYGS